MKLERYHMCKHTRHNRFVAKYFAHKSIPTLHVHVACILASRFVESTYNALLWSKFLESGTTFFSTAFCLQAKVTVFKFGIATYYNHASHQRICSSCSLPNRLLQVWHHVLRQRSCSWWYLLFHHTRCSYPRWCCKDPCPAWPRQGMFDSPIRLYLAHTFFE